MKTLFSSFLSRSLRVCLKGDEKVIKRAKLFFKIQYTVGIKKAEFDGDLESI
jgi:hypothetical protein